jgi:ppGpp synthetase/RelA/SpoT-type nucleotidyltranferase
MLKQNIEKMANLYKEKLPLYNDFTLSMQNLLIHLLKDNGFKYQITYRIKSITSATLKMIRKVQEGEEIDSVEDLHDLAGIRIIFYFESDKNKFIQCLYKELTSGELILKELHKEKGYRSVHIISKFGKKRLNLCEYKKYSGLKCEIQLTSVLFHAWSEIEHDIIYKNDEVLMENHKEAMLEIKNDLEMIMIDYIQKASDKFESIFMRVNQLADRE